MRSRPIQRLAAPFVGLVALLFFVAVVSYPTGAPAMRTGAPGDQTCNAFGCHNSFALNSGPGSVRIEAPADYAPGEPMELTVVVSQEGQIRFGFEITARDGSNDFAGSWTLGDNQEFADNNPEYVTHDQAPYVNDQASFTLVWNAPPAGEGDITFYAAGNAADGLGSNTGDHIYTTALVVTEGVDTGIELEELPRALEVTSVFPNPVVSGTTVGFELFRTATVRLSVYDAAGRLVRTVVGGVRPPGEHSLMLDAAGMSGGVYFYSLETSVGTKSGKLLVIR
ncbi:MAG: T9SS type A sorting domain-containing protein [Rhodothermales bacterium]|nr:T9SS type A sorting domain-containing protein [Rhodothermales bacterium]